MNDETAQTPEPFYPSVYAFVSDFLVHVYARRTGLQAAMRWCPRWWAHPEAMSRLEALWMAFEVQRQDAGLGAAIWWRDYADPTMTTLLDSDGPFRECGGDSHAVTPPLPTTPPPAGSQVWAG